MCGNRLIISSTLGNVTVSIVDVVVVVAVVFVGVSVGDVDGVVVCMFTSLSHTIISVSLWLVLFIFLHLGCSF